MQLDPDSEISDCLQQLRHNLQNRVRVIDMLIAASLGDRGPYASEETAAMPEAVSQVLPMLLQAMGSSSNTLLRLNDPPGLQTRDCFCIARSVIELAVNICYITAKGEDVAEKALRHARQKSVRDLTRESTIGDQKITLGFSKNIDVSKITGLREELAEFVSRSGREKGWIDESLDQRIEAAGQLDDQVFTGLHFGRVMIYRHSSEVLHGTLFGTAYLFGRTQPARRPESPADLVTFLAEQMMMILMATNLVHHAVTCAFDRRYGFRTARRQSDELTEALANIRMFRKL